MKKVTAKAKKHPLMVCMFVIWIDEASFIRYKKSLSLTIIQKILMARKEKGTLISVRFMYLMFRR